MKKVLNYRPIIFLCIVFALGIFIGFFSLTESFVPLIVILSLGLVFLLFCLVIYFFKLKRAFFVKLFKIKFFVLFSFIAFVLGFLMFNVAVTSYDSLNIDEKTYAFKGTVYGTYKEDEYVTLILENVLILDGEEEINLKQKSLLSFHALDEEEESKTEFRAGQVVTGNAGLKNILLINNKSINTFGIKNGFRYFLSSNDLIFENGNASFFSGLRQSTKDVLKENLNEEVYPTAYALIFGDTSEIDIETKEAFQKTGLAHIFAVSGLHIAFLMAGLLFIFKKLKLKYHYQFIISALILMFYAAICGFSPSILRAAVMTLIYLLAKAFGKQYDILSSLFLTALIIFIISPVYLFDAGFLMSFFSVLGIILLNPLFLKIFKFVPTKFLRNSISISLSAQIGVLPFMAFYFNYVPVLSIFLNIIAIPLVNITFILSFILVIFSVIPYISALFIIPEVLLEVVLFLVNITAGISFVNAELIFTSGFLLYFLIIIIVSRVTLIKKKFKAITASILSVLLITNLVLINLPKRFNGYEFSYYDIKSDIYSITDDGNFYLVLGGSGEADFKGLTSILKVQKIKTINAVIVYKTTDNYLTLISEVSKVSRVENVFIRESFIDDDPIYMAELKRKEINVEILNYKEPKKIGNISLTLYGDWVVGNGRYNSLYMDLYNYSMLFTGTLNQNAYSDLAEFTNLSPTVIFANNYAEELYKLYFPYAVITKWQQNYEPQDFDRKFYSKQVYGELIFEVKNGIIYRT